jgi:hypothetical protein
VHDGGVRDEAVPGPGAGGPENKFSYLIIPITRPFAATSPMLADFSNFTCEFQSFA